MLSGLAFIFLFGISITGLLKRVGIPDVVSLILTGVIIGPSVLNLLEPDFLAYSGDLQEIALIIILTNAGLHLDLSQLKQIGRPAILMSFLPATFEIIGCVILGPLLFGLSIIDSLIVGAVLGAVTPSILIPKMIELIDAKRGTKKQIPQILIAGASIDDIFCIILFASFIILKETGDFQAITLLKIPLAIITGLVGGFIIGYAIENFFKKVHVRDTSKILVILSLSSLLVIAEPYIEKIIPFSALLAVMCAAIVINTYDPIRAHRLSFKFNKLWIGAQLWVFALVGAAMPLQETMKFAVPAVLLILLALLFRSIGVVLSLMGNGISRNQIIFSIFASIPKGTVQAAIGGIALSKGLENGDIILAISVVSILVTAPLGAILIDRSAYKLLPLDE